MRWPMRSLFSGPACLDPFEEIKRTQGHLNQLFEDFMPTIVGWGGGKVYTPAIDIKEEEDKLVVTTNLPGINKDDVQINLKEDMLEIRAKNRKEKETKEKIYLLQEGLYTQFTQFYRLFRLPISVKEEGSTAKMENGILTITLPKMVISRDFVPPCDLSKLYFAADGSNTFGTEKNPGIDVGLYYCVEHGEIFLKDIAGNKTEPICPWCQNPLKVIPPGRIKIYYCEEHGVISSRNIVWKRTKPYCPNHNCLNLLKIKFDTEEE